ncbi:unnamed protein product [Rhizophagus irregularis]|uniref:RNase H type-1 domain-containing protein n=1 Tax=Rhizophagus irregularis TaxID=588596 RepID=A0A916E922_9GLOM|nr:unnamed protein product [Rhizophagus irregularis]
MIDSILERKRKTIILDRLLIERDGVQSLCLDDKEIVKEAENHYQNVAGKRSNNFLVLDDRWSNRYKPIQQIDQMWYSEILIPISIEEWRDMINSLPNDKASGPSKISNEMLKKAEIHELKLDYNLGYTNPIGNSTRINVSSQAYMDDVTWLTEDKFHLEQILKIADQFNKFNNIQVNYNKFEITTNSLSVKDNDIINIKIGNEKKNIAIVKANQSVRILGVWINLNLDQKFVFNQCKDIIKQYNILVKRKDVTSKQLKYIFNHVILPRIDYKAQLNIWNKVQCDQINRIGRAMFKKKCAVVSTMPNCLIYSSFGYKIKDIYVLQLQRQFTRLRNQMNATGIVNTVLWIRAYQLQQDCILKQSPLHEWNISSNNFTLKFDLLGKILALMYDNNLELVANSTTSNKLTNGKCSLNGIIDHSILYKKGVFKQLSRKGIVFLSQLLSSDGNRMLRYKDLKNRFNISTKGRIPIWFKQLETIFITDHKLSRKVKDEFNIGRHYQFISPSIENVNVKSRDWIATYTKITDEAVIARIIDNQHDSLIAEHWIQDVKEEISPSVQLPVIKKCNGCDLKLFHTRSPRSSVKKRCLFKVDKQTTIKVKASSIECDKYIMDTAIFENLALAENLFYTDNFIGVNTSLNDVLKYVSPFSVRSKLLEIKSNLSDAMYITAYTDGSLKSHASSASHMGGAFVITEPISVIFNVSFEDQPSVVKAELLAILLLIMTCPKYASVLIYCDSQIIVTKFLELFDRSLAEINKMKLPYQIYWTLLFKFIKFFALDVRVEKVKAHSNNQYNDLADKYAKESIDEDSIIFHDQILNFKALIKWNHLIVERDDIQLIKQIFEADNLNQFLNLNRNNLINNRHFFTLVDWKTSYRLNKKSQYITSKGDEVFQQLAFKIKANELPTLDNLHKRSPRLYPSNLQCQFCKNCNETLHHLWTCSQLTVIYKELFDSLYDILSVWIKKFCTLDNVDDILDQEKSIFIQSLQMSNDFNISHLAKGLISMKFVGFLREKFKLDQNSRDIIFEQFYRIVIFKFSFYIWIKRNSLVLDLERHIGITNKMKKNKRKYTGNHNLVTVSSSFDNNLFKDTDRFKYWLKYAYAYGGYFLDF